MGVIVNKNNLNKDQLSQRINADLRERAVAAADTDDEDVDFAENSEYVKDLKKTGRFGWVWIILIVLAILSLILIVFL